MLPRNALPPPLLMKRTFGREKDSRTAGVQTSELAKCLALDRENENFSFAGHTFLFLIGNGLEKIPCYPRQGFFFSSRLTYLSFFRKVFVKMLLYHRSCNWLEKKNPL